MDHHAEAAKYAKQDSLLVIIQPVLPHYRVPLFQILSNEPDLRSTIICGHSLYDLDSVATTGIKRIDIHNCLLFGGRLVFQDLPSMVYKAPVVVMEFNPRVLSNYPVILWRTLARRPFIFWGHGISPRADSPRWIVHFRKIMAQMASALIFYSEKGRQEFIKLGIQPDKLFVAPNTIDLNAIWWAKERQRTQDRDQIIYIGRLIPAKKTDILIEAFNQVYQQLPEHIGLTIIGDGPERKKLESIARHGGASQRITFTGHLTEQSDIAPYMTRALVSVSAGYIGLSAIHSLAYGVPLLVAQSEPHSPEIDVMVPGKTGEFYAPNTPEVLGQALVEMLSDPDLITEMSLHAVESIHAQFTLDNMVRAFKDSCHFALKIRQME